MFTNPHFWAGPVPLGIPFFTGVSGIFHGNTNFYIFARVFTQETVNFSCIRCISKLKCIELLVMDEYCTQFRIDQLMYKLPSVYSAMCDAQRLLCKELVSLYSILCMCD